MIFEIPLADGRSLAAVADPSLSAAAYALLARLAPEIAEIPRDGRVVEPDWARLSLTNEGGRVWVREADPRGEDFDAIDPTLRRLVAQAELFRRLDVAGEPLQPGQYCCVAIEAMEAPAIRAKRIRDDDPLMTGWQIDPADGPGKEYGLYSTREIAEARPEWLPCLGLPIGWSFRLEQNTLVNVCGPNSAAQALNIELPA